MSKITVNICTGTTCFVMGGANLQELVEILPKKYGDKIDVKGSPCLDLCTKSMEYAGAPYVKIDDDIITEATVEKVLEAIEKKLGNS